MPPQFRAVIFDLDGVLADSEPWWNQIDAKLLAQYGVTYRGEYHRNVLGVSYRLAVEFYKNVFRISATLEELMRNRGKIATEFFANRVSLFPSAKGAGRTAGHEAAARGGDEFSKRVCASIPRADENQQLLRCYSDR